MRWQEYTELYKKRLNDPGSHDGVITHTHVESDIMEGEVKWVLGNITMNKAGGSDGIPAELFQIPKDDTVKVLQSTGQQILENSAVATGLLLLLLLSRFSCVRLCAAL